MKHLRKLVLALLRAALLLGLTPVFGADEPEGPDYSTADAVFSPDVALSRAKKKFVITYCKTVYYGENAYAREPSPYIKNLPAQKVSANLK